MPDRRSMHCVLTAVAAAAMVALMSCAPMRAEPNPTFDRFFVDILAEARAADASETQMALLEDAAVAGELTYEQAETQLGEYFSCLEDAGLEPARRPDREDPPGFHIPAYTVGLGYDETKTDAAMALLNACNTEHYKFVDMAYQLQPKAIDLEDADVEAHRSEILACLAENGGDADPDATTDELVDAVLQVGARSDILCYAFY